MILIDCQHLFIEAASGSLNRIQRIDPKLCRHIFLKRLASLIGRHSKEFGEPIFCRDGRGYWRRDQFQYYKSERAKGREQSSLDWGAVFDVADTISKELEEVFKFQVFRLPKMEADDIIAHIVRNDPRKHVIVSRDGDFLQLKAFGNVTQWDCTKSEFLNIEEGQTMNEFMIDHIVRGDSGDGVPNIMSDDDWLANKIRQTPIRKEMIDWLASKFDFSSLSNVNMRSVAEEIATAKPFASAMKKHGLTIEQVEARLNRNRDMVDLTRDNPIVDKEVSQMLKESTSKKFDAMEVLDFCADLGLEEISGDLNKFVWWNK